MDKFLDALKCHLDNLKDTHAASLFSDGERQGRDRASNIALLKAQIEREEAQTIPAAAVDADQHTDAAAAA